MGMSDLMGKRLKGKGLDAGGVGEVLEAGKWGDGGKLTKFALRIRSFLGTGLEGGSVWECTGLEQICGVPRGTIPILHSVPILFHVEHAERRGAKKQVVGMKISCESPNASQEREAGRHHWAVEPLPARQTPHRQLPQEQ